MLILAVASILLSPMSGSCDVNLAPIGLCSSNSGSQITIDGSITTPGGSPQQPIGAPWDEIDAGNPDGGTIDAGPPPTFIDRGAICAIAPACLPAPADPAEPGAPAAPVIDYTAITQSDLVSFSPASATASIEPSGLGIAGMPVNIVASAAAQTLEGDLFGQRISVIFEPVAYTFDYGDGTIRDSDTGGESWEALGLPQFTATATSHAYTAPGEYTVSISVHYAATIQAPDGTWFPIAGTVASAASAHGIRVLEVTTALVQRSCNEDPTGPAC